LHEMVDGSLGAIDVVYPDVIRFESGQAASEKYDRKAAVPNLHAKFRRPIRGWAKEHSVRRILLHRRKEPLLFADRFRRVSKQNYITCASKFVFDSDDDLGEKRIGDICDNQTDGVRPLGAKTCRAAMIDVPEPAHGAKDLFPRFLCDDGNIAEDQRDGGARNGSVEGDIPESDARLCFDRWSTSDHVLGENPWGGNHETSGVSSGGGKH